MFAVRSSSALRRVLWLDAASGLGLCLSHGLGSAVLTSWTGIPADLLQLAALIVLAAASMAAWLASRPQLPLTGVRCLALGNFAWVAASAWLVWGSGMALTPLGQGWVVLQGLVVLVLAELEWAGSSGPEPRAAV